MWWYYGVDVVGACILVGGLFFISFYIIDIFSRISLFHDLGTGCFISALIPFMSEFSLALSYVALLEKTGRKKKWHNIMPPLAILCTLGLPYAIMCSLSSIYYYHHIEKLNPDHVMIFQILFIISIFVIIGAFSFHIWTAVTTSILSGESFPEVLLYIVCPFLRSGVLKSVYYNAAGKNICRDKIRGTQ